MSGGAFNYYEQRLIDIAATIEQIIKDNDSIEKDRWGDDIGHHFPKEIIEKFEETALLIRKVYFMIHYIDYLLESDFGEESFLKAWEKKLKEIEQDHLVKNRDY